MSPPLAALGDVCVARSSLVDPSDPEFHEFPHIAPDIIERNTGNLHPYRTVLEDGVTSGKYRFEPGDVLYSKIRPNLNKVAQVDFAGLCSADMYALHVDRMQATPSYVTQLLRSDGFLRYATSLSNRANIPKLNRGQLLSFRFRLPPLDEQRRIAAILDQADALRAKRRQALAQLDSLAQSIFFDEFGDVPATKPMSAIVEEFRYGTSSKSGDAGYPALRIPNVIGGAIDTGEIKTVEVGPSELKRLTLRDGDLLFVRTNGNPDNVGRSAIFSEAAVKPAGFHDLPWIYASYLIRARLSDGVEPRFVAAYLAGPEGRAQLRERSKTSAGQYNINTEALGSLRLPSAPLTAQREFARRVGAIEKRRRQILEAQVADEDLFASLQSQAFRGEL